MFTNFPFIIPSQINTEDNEISSIIEDLKETGRLTVNMEEDLKSVWLTPSSREHFIRTFRKRILNQ